MKYLSSQKIELIERQVFAMGDYAYVVTRSKMRANDDESGRISGETMVLRKTEGMWKIIHINWSN